jgi:hypothetical protein
VKEAEQGRNTALSSVSTPLGGPQSIPIPDDSTAVELRRKQNASPIDRGQAVERSVIEEGLARERVLVKPEEIVRGTEPGDPLFAASVIASQEKSAEEKQEELKRAGEAIERGNALAEEAGKKRDLKSLRTFQSDLAEAMRGEGQSIVRNVLSEHGKEIEKEEVVSRIKKKHNMFVYVGIMFVVFGLVALAFGGGYLYSFLAPFGGGSSARTLNIPEFFSVEDAREIDTTGLDEDALRAYAGSVVFGMEKMIDSFVQLYAVEWEQPELGEKKEPVARLLSTEEWLARIGAKAPARLVRALDAAYMFGVHIWNGNQGFLVFIVRDGMFDDAFSSMLEWEEDMAARLIPLFGTTPDVFVLNADWSDTVIKNRDVRVLKNASDEIVLLYTFYDRKTLIVSTGQDTMEEIINRIIQGKRK